MLLLGDFALINETVDRLWQRLDEEFQGKAWTRITVVEDMSEGCVRHNRVDREGCEYSRKLLVREWG
jgi:hypothetical protein